MFIFGFFKFIIIGIIAFIIIIVSSIAASDWDFTKDEFINTLKLIFENRVEICNECNICNLYKRFSSSLYTNKK